MFLCSVTYRTIATSHPYPPLFSLLSLSVSSVIRMSFTIVNTLISTLDAHAHGEILPMREEREKERKREREKRESPSSSSIVDNTDNVRRRKEKEKRKKREEKEEERERGRESDICVEALHLIS